MYDDYLLNLRNEIRTREMHTNIISIYVYKCTMEKLKKLIFQRNYYLK